MTVWFVGWWLGFSSELVGCRAKFAEGGPSILEILKAGTLTMKYG